MSTVQLNRPTTITLKGKGIEIPVPKWVYELKVMALGDKARYRVNDGDYVPLFAGEWTVIKPTMGTRTTGKVKVLDAETLYVVVA